MSNDNYLGKELDLFSNAKNWKNYWKKEIYPYLGFNILDVGSGIGSNLELLWKNSSEWVCLEPDPKFLSKINNVRNKINAKNSVKILNGDLNSLKVPKESFDTIIYIDVLEHILEDKKELKRATFFLKPGGHLIILSPAFQFLYSPFDKAIGHYRRYTIKSLMDISPLNCQIVKSNYLDSIGCLASLVNKLFLRSSIPSISQINFWDKKIIPLSYFFDKLFLNSFGRSLYFVWKKSC